MNRLREFWSFLKKPDVYWRIFSLLLAITLWLLAAGDGNLGETERIISLSVGIENLPRELVLVDHPEDIKVRVRGFTPILNRGEDLIDARIDLSGAVEGTETYSVDVEAPLGIEVIGITPPWVSVYTEELASSAFPVTLALLRLNPNQNLAGINPLPAVITVMGPRSILEQVDHVVAYVNLDDSSALYEQSFPVQALDAQGRSLSQLAIEPAEIRIEEPKEEEMEEQNSDGEE